MGTIEASLADARVDLAMDDTTDNPPLADAPLQPSTLSTS